MSGLVKQNIMRTLIEEDPEDKYEYSLLVCYYSSGRADKGADVSSFN